MRLCWAAVLMLCVAGAVRGDWTLVGCDLGTKGRININEWNKEGLSYTDENGKVGKAATREVVELDNDRPGAQGSAGWKLKLRNGDVIVGDPAGMQGQNVQMKVAELGTVEVPIKVIATLAAKDSKAPAGAGAGDKDSVRLKNGDMLEGLFAAVDEGKIQMQGELGNTDVDLERVDRLTLGGVTPARALPTLSWRVHLITGTVLTTGALTWTINDITMKDPAGVERKCAADQVASIEVLGGCLTWLTELDPAKEEATSFFGTKWPMQMNLNVLGLPLKVAGHTYTRGLGVHTKSVLTYDLDGSFNTVTLRVGMDDSAAPYGQANVAVVADGKVLWEGKGIKAGAAAEGLTLELKGAKHLELRAEPASRMDVLGRVDWVEVGLHRP